MKSSGWRWAALSDKQQKIFKWWVDGSPYADYEGIIADGAIRSGKTVSMGMAFVLWAMETFNGEQFAMCGKTIASLRRNVLNTLKSQLKSEGYVCVEKRSDNYLLVAKGEKSNRFYLFGGKDERSQDLIQGVTLAGAFFDEVALMPESFVNQATGRCSVDGSKWWFNCNPAGPQHWFYVNWIRKVKERKIVYLHFTMEDNLTLTQRIRQRYASQYTSVFFQRYILGMWVAAEGLVYRMFDKDRHTTDQEPETEGPYYVSSDYGIYNTNVFQLWRAVKGSNKWFCFWEETFSARDSQEEKTLSELVSDLKTRLGEIMPEKIIIDPSASAMIAELKRKGFRVQKADNEVLDGITDVQTMLVQDRLLYNRKTCKEAIKEYGLYSWDSKKADNGKDEVIKQNDHSMDATRYFVRTRKLVKREDKGTSSEQYSYLA